MSNDLPPTADRRRGRGRRRTRRGRAGRLQPGRAAGCPGSRGRRRGPKPPAGSHGRRTVTARLTPQPATLDLGGRTVPTWAYGDALPGPLIRATAGDLLRVEVDNQLLDTSTSVHWHGARAAQRHGRRPRPHPGADRRGRLASPTSSPPRTRARTSSTRTRGPARPRPVRGADRRGPGRARRLRHGVGRRPGRLGRRHRPHPRRGPRRADWPTGGTSRDGARHGRHGPWARHGAWAAWAAMQSPLLGGAGDVAYPHYLINGRPGGPGHAHRRSRGSGCGSGSSTPAPTPRSGWRWAATG